MKIFLLEDEVILCNSIQTFLEKIGHEVHIAYNGKEAFEKLQQGSYDLLILDINVPEIDGFELLIRLHEHSKYTPTIYISALQDIEDIEKAFNIGCEDYLKKPFHLKELQIRVEKVAKHLENKNHIKLSQNYSFSFEKRTLYYNNTPVELTKRQLQIIELLAKNRGNVVNFEMFRDYIYNEEYVDNPTIRAEISRLKKILKEDFIKNIRGLGYKIP